MKDVALLTGRVIMGLLVAGHGVRKVFGWFEGELGPGSRVAVEVSAESARELVRCIEAALIATGSMA